MIYSDHTPILAVLNSQTQKSRKPFRFENWWLLEDDFSPTATHSWQRSANMPFHTKARRLATDLKVWQKKKKPLHV